MIALSNKIFALSLLIWSSQYSHNSHTNGISYDKNGNAYYSLGIRHSRLLYAAANVECQQQYDDLKGRIKNILEEDDETFRKNLNAEVYDEHFGNHFNKLRQNDIFPYNYNEFIEDDKFQVQFNEMEESGNISKKYNPSRHYYGEDKYISSYNFDDHNEEVYNELDNNDDFEGFYTSKRNYYNKEPLDMEIYDQGSITMRNHKKNFHKDLNFRNKNTKKIISDLRRFLRKIDKSIESKLVKLIQKHLKIMDKTHSTKSQRKLHKILRFLHKHKPSPLCMLVISTLIGIIYGFFGSFAYTKAVSTFTILSLGNPFIGLASLYSIIFMSVIVAYIITGGAFIVQYMFFKILKIYLTYRE
ncbi:hypothetical protein POWCR01_000042900 [Plasmodium ovale]|uniref:Pv-fam-d protein n=1 Tax=Plasmodium ovale TaxID=36330 RepID=A0A1C3KG54_PLAOA|nr:hypothetical protein POWCR01_000042900 [Plasmodium ovale]